MLDVYKSCYRLQDQPFRLSPDSRFSYGHRSYENAHSYLKYAITEGEGIVAVTGAPGTGKTTLIATLMAELNPEFVRAVTLESAQIRADALLDAVIEAFNVRLAVKELTQWEAFKRYLIEGARKGMRNILIIDEAQCLSKQGLEDLRLLSNMQFQNQLLLQIFLVGQEALLDNIRAPGMEQLHQRLIAASHLDALNKEETVAYVEHRLHQVGWIGSPEITHEAMSLIHKFSAGVPRKINLICHRLFILGGLKNKLILNGEDALHVVVELHREGLLPPVVRRV